MPIAVRLYDLDLRGEVSNATLLRYFEQAAVQASSHLGFTMQWYQERGVFWVIRTIRLERSIPAHYSSDLEISTWVSSLARVRSDRNYCMRQRSDGKMLARATVNWVYLDAKTLFPTRISPEIVSAFRYTDPEALPPRGIPRWLQTGQDLEGITTRRAQFYEADSARHTNNAVYIDWLEEAVRDTLLANGYPLPLDGPPSLWFYRHSVEYLNAARPGDLIEISTRLAGTGKSTGYWTEEIRRAGTGERVARNECVTLWRDEKDLVIPWPATIHQRI